VYFAGSSVPSFVEGSSADDSESDRLQRLKARILQMERDIRGIHAMAAIIKKKGELAIDAERYALCELQKAIESLNCKCLFPFVSFNTIDNFF
jgi:hypothetical protein